MAFNTSQRMHQQVSVLLLALVLLVTPVLSAFCPDSCTCSTTRDGLHRAVCGNISELYKYTLRQKHHNINVLDLSHNNITKLTHELDRLTEIVSLDLSTNGITELVKFLHNAKKLVHLNLANNRLRQISLSSLPTSVSSLDLTNNLLQDLPSDLGHLGALEHLEMEGNPLECSCKNIMGRDRLLAAKVLIDNVKCASPHKFIGQSWLQLKTKEICKKTESNYLDMMMGDQPIDALEIEEEANGLKPKLLTASNDLADVNVIQDHHREIDDDQLFLRVPKSLPSSAPPGIEGSGDTETTTDPDVEAKSETESSSDLSEQELNTETPEEGSGEGSGFGFPLFDTFVKSVKSTTEPPELYTGRVMPLIPEDSTEFPQPPHPDVYEGGPLWHSEVVTEPKVEIAETEKPIIPQVTRDTTVSEPIRVTQASDMNEQLSTSNDSPPPHKTGTYVCIAIIVVLLVGLIGFAIIKGQMRKRRDRRLLRQQKRDVEKASKEMVDMNKSLLGKPANIEPPAEKRANGKYELVPTHDTPQKKSENKDVGNGVSHNGNTDRTDSPRDSNQNKSSSKDNNLADDKTVPTTLQETSFDSEPASPDSRKDTHSLSSEDIFVPLNDEDTPKVNGVDADVSQPLLNGDQNRFSDFLSPSREYVPVYSPDMGRVRIKMTETPKPKTPVLVTRSRSNAGDIIITPSVEGNSTT